MINTKQQIKTFWIAFFAVIATLAIAVAAYVGITSAQKIDRINMSAVSDDNPYKISRENTYRQSLYLACDGMKNLDANLGKATASNHAATQAKLLTNVVVCASSVNQQFANLPIEASDKLMACGKFVNQTQDYAQYLVGRLANGQGLTAEEKKCLDNLDNVATNMYDFLQEYATSDSGMFMTNGTGNYGVGALSDSLADVDERAFAYEKLIYDGPFSDSVQNKVIPTHGKLSVKDCAAKVTKTFAKATYVSTLNGENVLYVFDTDIGRVTTTTDGNIVEYDNYTDGETGNIARDKAVAAAEEFCAKLGYDVKGVWVSKTADYVTYVNCAPVVDGMIVYPQLIKVAVDGNGNVVGMEAKAYLTNRDTKPVAFGSVSESDARANLDSGLTVTTTARALVERNGKTYACWQFECARAGRQYYVYVDSTTGEEINIFKVIQNTEGFTVI